MSILLQWCFYELHRRPASVKDLKDELDAVFGPDRNPRSVIEQLRGPEAGKLLACLPYTDAVIKEALRLHPPGTTARVTPKGTGTTLTLPDGERLVVDGLCLTPRAYVIQRLPKIFGETRDDFMPERWLGEAGARIPDSAFRPYERGPMRCTGSELANSEAALAKTGCLPRVMSDERHTGAGYKV
jgi:cytochrome P450